MSDVITRRLVNSFQFAGEKVITLSLIALLRFHLKQNKIITSALFVISLKIHILLMISRL